jgi:hypothetical protein
MREKLSAFGLIIPAVALLGPVNLTAAGSPDIATEVVEATTMLRGKNSTATCFLLRRPSTARPGQDDFLLVTAGHVLGAMESEDARLLLRKPRTDGTYQADVMTIKVRAKGKPLWTKHPEVDAAAMPCPLPKGTGLVPLRLNALATTNMTEGGRLAVAGALRFASYPFKVVGTDGFPTVRHGTVASFPLFPVNRYKTFLIDCATSEGDSGGPVFLLEGHHDKDKEEHGPRGFIVGMIYGRGSDPDTKTDLHLAAAIHAAYIRETVDLVK